ncbi:MAG: aminopeptidase P family protein [Armatimonadetes bacterium]|nr:aminopeptidase P family protein [Armatimonadota bacterium]
MTIDYRARVAAAQNRMKELGIELLVVPRTTNMEWLVGVRRDKAPYTAIMHPGAWAGAVYLGQDKGPIVALPRMDVQFELGDIPGMEVRVIQDADDHKQFVLNLINEFKLNKKTIAVEDRSHASTLFHLQELVPDGKFDLAYKIFRPLRNPKTEAEIERMCGAAKILDAAMGDILKKIRIGMTELELYSETEHQLYKHGSYAPSFPTSIYIENPNRATKSRELKGKTNHPLERGTAIAFDFGAVYQGYSGDFGRTVWLGKPPEEFLKTHKLVMDSQAAGITAAKTGITAEDLNQVARKVIEDGGYGPNFRHRLGHGMGMDCHEPPFLTPGDKTVLKAGMVFTIEPSIAIDNKWVVRVEDAVVIRDGGGEPLSTFRKDVLVVD